MTNTKVRVGGEIRSIRQASIEKYMLEVGTTLCPSPIIAARDLAIRAIFGKACSLMNAVPSSVSPNRWSGSVVRTYRYDIVGVADHVDVEVLSE